MNNKYKVLIKISGKYSTQKHADLLSAFILNSFSEREESESVVVKTVINKNEGGDWFHPEKKPKLKKLIIPKNVI